MFAAPGVVWLLAFFVVAFYAVMAVAFGSVDPILRTARPSWNPLQWDTHTFRDVVQRVATGDLSDFLKGLHDHLTDISGLEILTLLPLGILVVAFGLFPGLLLDLVNGSVATVLSQVAGGTAIHLIPWQ